MDTRFITHITTFFMIIGCHFAAHAAKVTNPVIWADIPDPSIVRVDNKYYMSHTTMHMSPGVPIMESADMVNWRTVSYCHSALVNNDQLNLANGKNAYGKGSWASSIRYKNGTFFVLVPSQTSGKTHLYTTKNIANGSWNEVTFPLWHDPSLFFDDDDRSYVLWGQGNINIIELDENLQTVKSGGLNKILLSNPHTIASANVNLPAEGTHIVKVKGYYYIFNICWPAGGMRTQICNRSKSLSGPWEGKVVLSSNGVAQGSILQMSDSSWMAYLFQDNGAVGRCPWLIPVTWQNDWPVFGNGKAPPEFTLTSAQPFTTGYGVVSSDNFTDKNLGMEWQFNHNPDTANWSLTQNPGHLRIRTSRIDNNITLARNSVTQRSFGPRCSGRTRLSTKGLYNGDYAGLCALQNKYGLVGIKRSGDTRSIIMMNGTKEAANVPVEQDDVYLRIDMDFMSKTDKATFFYSLDSVTWKPIGEVLQMSYDIPHFMGYRFALFNYATKTAGGIADFDWFEIGSSVSERIDLYQATLTMPSGIRKPGQPSFILLTPSGTTSLCSVNCQLSMPGLFSLDILDLQGRLNKRLFSGYLGAGSHDISCQLLPSQHGRYLFISRFNNEVINVYQSSHAD